MRARSTLSFAATLILATSGAVSAQQTSPTMDADGTIHAQDVVIPTSDLLSAQAKRLLIERIEHNPKFDPGPNLVERARAASLEMAQPVVKRWQEIYPATIQRVTMNGVPTDVIVPRAGIAAKNRHRVLINLHGGGFFTGGGGAAGQVESLPLAGEGRIKVVAVDYRLAPENKFPAASQDVEQVYRALLKTYKPENIGIFGCSAGGALTAQSTAWLQKQHLPRPGAIGIFCSGLMPGFWTGGDSSYVAPVLNRQLPYPAERIGEGMSGYYLSASDAKNPLAVPGISLSVLSHFPPTLLVSGTRDVALSNLLASNVALKQAGVETELLVLEGLGHGDVFLFAGAPEAKEADALIWRFFDKHLGR